MNKLIVKIISPAVLAVGLLSFSGQVSSDASAPKPVGICTRYQNPGPVPCVWWDPYQGPDSGGYSSFVMLNSSTVNLISDSRAQDIFKTALMRKADTGKSSGPLSARVNVCHDQVGGSGSKLPCVFDTTVFGIGRDGRPVFVNASGSKEFVSFDRARELTLAVAYR